MYLSYDVAPVVDVFFCFLMNPISWSRLKTAILGERERERESGENLSLVCIMTECCFDVGTNIAPCKVRGSSLDIVARYLLNVLATYIVYPRD